MERAARVNVDFPARSFFDVFVDISLPDLQVKNSNDDVLTLDLPGVSSLDDIAGIAITGSILNGSSSESNITGITGNITATPLPATLPLFATGLGAMGLFGWRRKRKSQAAA